MNNQSDVNSLGEGLTPVRRICWSAIFAGAFTGVGLGFLLQLYGIAIGLSAYSSSSSGTAAIAIGGFLGLLVGVIASMVTAGFVSGHLGRFYYNHCYGGIIYGFLTWSMALVFSAFMLLPLAHYTSSYTKALAPHVEVTSASHPSTEIKSDEAHSTSMKETTETYPTEKDISSALTGSSWIVFLLFFIGALSCCVGACWGITCRKDANSNFPSSILRR